MSNILTANNNQSDDSVSAQVEHIYNEHHSIMHKKIRSLQFSRNDHEDVLQDFFLMLLSKPIAPALANSRAYLCRVLQNDLIDTIRKEKCAQKRIASYYEYYRMRHEDEYTQDNIIELKESIILLLQKYDLAINVIQIFLPPRLATALLLYYQDSHTYKQIAQELSITQYSARRYVSMGLKELRVQLKARGLLKLLRINENFL